MKSQGKIKFSLDQEIVREFWPFDSCRGGGGEAGEGTNGFQNMHSWSIRYVEETISQ